MALSKIDFNPAAVMLAVAERTIGLPGFEDFVYTDTWCALNEIHGPRIARAMGEALLSELQYLAAEIAGEMIGAGCDETAVIDPMTGELYIGATAAAIMNAMLNREMNGWVKFGDWKMSLAMVDAITDARLALEFAGDKEFLNAATDSEAAGD